VPKSAQDQQIRTAGRNAFENRLVRDRNAQRSGGGMGRLSYYPKFSLCVWKLVPCVVFVDNLASKYSEYLKV
jgi:hypothetical protein